MELTRRDALAALASAGIVGGAGAAALSRDQRGPDEPTDEATLDAESRDEMSGPTGTAVATDEGARTEAILDALVGTATVVYPSAVENVEAFVRTYGREKLSERPAYREGADRALESIDSQAELTLDASFAELEGVERETVLKRLGADSASPDPEGSAPGRVRYYYVNEVLFALYSSPTGGELVGIENPQGHPGGTDSYQRGPGRPTDQQNRERTEPTDGTESER
jgi:hypothetical protein